MASFIISAEQEKAPALITFKNNSTGADTYNWEINGQAISQESDMEYLILESGRYDVSLEAVKDGKNDIQTKTIFVDAPEKCHVYMKTTMGDFVFELSELTPGHRDNFIDLIEKGYYHGLKFHRVIDGFMVQGGDNATRSEKTDIEFRDQIPDEIDSGLLHFKGALAAARMPDNVNPDKYSSGTQFYIVEGRPLTEDEGENYNSGNLIEYNQKDKETYMTQGGTPQLDGEYTVFGRLVKGFNVLEKISNTETAEMDAPLNDIFIIETLIIN